MTHKLRRGLYVLVDDSLAPSAQWPALAQAAVQAGVSAVQLRLKSSSTRVALAGIASVKGVLAHSGCPLIVNDRIDWALVSGADGVHLGDDDMPAAVARRVLGPSALVGITVRSELGARAAAEAGADYVGVGPVFGTTTKTVSNPVLGLSGLAKVVAASPLPVVAIGGIGGDACGLVAATGACCAAVASAFCQAQSPVSFALAAQRAFSGHTA
jgi:thiamine-phosphate pyrophosphorylase